MTHDELFYEKLNAFDYPVDEVEYEEDEWQDGETLAEYRARCPWMFVG